MKYDFISVLELCGVCGGAFWFIGFCALMVAVHKARREFRVKGYLRPPSGRDWFPFLLWKQYDAFENPDTRFFFGISHFCLVVIMIVVAAVAVLLGCELLLKNVAGGPSI